MKARIEETNEIKVIVTAHDYDGQISCAKLPCHWSKLKPRLKGFEAYPLFITSGEELNKIPRSNQVSDIVTSFKADEEYGIADRTIFILPTEGYIAFRRRSAKRN